MAAHRSPLWQEVKCEILSSYLRVIDSAEKDEPFDRQNFAQLLVAGLGVTDMSAAELARQEDVPRSVISRWLHGVTVPTAPTRKQVLGQVIARAREQLRALDGA